MDSVKLVPKLIIPVPSAPQDKTNLCENGSKDISIRQHNRAFVCFLKLFDAALSQGLRKQMWKEQDVRFLLGVAYQLGHEPQNDEEILQRLSNTNLSLSVCLVLGNLVEGGLPREDVLVIAMHRRGLLALNEAKPRPHDAGLAQLVGDYMWYADEDYRGVGK